MQFRHKRRIVDVDVSVDRSTTSEECRWPQLTTCQLLPPMCSLQRVSADDLRCHGHLDAKILVWNVLIKSLPPVGTCRNDASMSSFSHSDLPAAQHARCNHLTTQLCSANFFLKKKKNQFSTSSKCTSSI